MHFSAEKGLEGEGEEEPAGQRGPGGEEKLAKKWEPTQGKTLTVEVAVPACHSQKEAAFLAEE